MRKFWRFWFIKTEQEKRFIEACLEIYKKMFDYISPDKVLSVYVGGSFARRDLTDESDIDLFIIIKNDEDLDKLKKLGRVKYSVKGIRMRPHIFSLGELESQEYKAPRMIGRMGHPTEILAALVEYQFVWGEKLIPHEIAEIKSDDQFLRENVKRVEAILARPRTDVAKWLKSISKHMFFVVHYEARVRLNQKFHFHREKLLRRFRRENVHIIHLCDAVRKNPESPVFKKDEFVKKIKEYLDFVERNYFNL